MDRLATSPQLDMLVQYRLDALLPYTDHENQLKSYDDYEPMAMIHAFSHRYALWHFVIFNNKKK